MAQVVVKVLGSSPRDVEASTVGDVKRSLHLEKYSAAVNGDPASDSTTLSENDFVTLSPSVKGA